MSSTGPSEQARAARKGRTGELLRLCRSKIVAQLKDWAVDISGSISERLFDEASQAANSQAQAGALAASRVLAKAGESFAAALDREFCHGFDTVLRQRSVDPDDEDHSLTLVEEEELSETLAISELVSRSEVRFTQSLFALHARMAVLNAGRHLDNDTNPLAPAQIGAAVRSAAQELGVEAETRVLVYQGYGELMLEHLGEVYEDLNQTLIDAGVLPNYKPRMKDRAGTGDPGAAPGPASDSPEPEAGDDEEQISANREALQQIFQLLERSQPRLPRPRGPVAQRPDLMSALDQIQPQAEGAVSADWIKRQLGEALKPSGVVVSPESSRVIDVMSMVHDFAEQELVVPAAFRDLLERLRMPLMRAALADQAMVEDPQHPARRFLEMLARTGEMYLDDDNVHGKVMHRLKDAVGTVLERFSGDMNVFTELVDDLHHHLDALKKRASALEKRQVAEEEGKARLAEARRESNETIAAILDKTSPPRFLASLLENAWEDYLALIHVRGGFEGDDWNRAVATGRFVALTAAEKTTRSTARQLKGKAAAAIKVLRVGLTQVGYTPDDVKKIEARIIRSLMWTTERAEGEEPPQELVKDFKPAVSRPKPVAPPKPEPRKALNAGERRQLVNLQQTKFGTWFEIRRPDGDWLKRKLSWHNPVSGHCLLVDQMGRPLRMGMDALAQMMDRDEARILNLNDKPLFDRAFKGIMKRLKSLVSNKEEPLQGAREPT